jgi:hypothetical protein
VRTATLYINIIEIGGALACLNGDMRSIHAALFIAMYFLLSMKFTPSFFTPTKSNQFDAETITLLHKTTHQD